MQPAGRGLQGDGRLRSGQDHDVGKAFVDLPQVQRALDRWREIYNHERPHDALGLATPASRYAASIRSMPRKLSAIEYGPDDEVQEVKWNGRVNWRGRHLKVSNALHRLPIAFRPDPTSDGAYDLYFCHHRFMRIALNQSPATDEQS